MSYILYVKNRETNEWESINSLKGTNGVGIQKTEINTNGELEITYTDNTTVNIGRVVGSNGNDYVLTETDKQEIVNDVINALPLWEGGEY